MPMLTISDFTKKILVLQRYFGKQLDNDIIEIYWSSLKDVQSDEFDKICTYLIRNYKPTGQKPFPLVSDFLDGRAGVDPSTDAVDVTDLVYEAAGKIGNYASVNFKNPALHATIRHYGGWNTVSLWTDEEWGFKRKDFRETYKSFRKTGTGDSYHLMGLHEIANMGNPKFRKFNSAVHIISREGGCLAIEKEYNLIEKSKVDKSLPELQDNRIGVKSAEEVIDSLMGDKDGKV